MTGNRARVLVCSDAQLLEVSFFHGNSRSETQAVFIGIYTLEELLWTIRREASLKS